MTMQDLVDTTRKLEDRFDGMGQPYLINAAGKEDLGGGVSVGITVAMQNALLAFEGRTTPAETGTVTSNPGTPIVGQDVFEDTAANFTLANVARGSLVVNFDDRSIAEVVAVESATRLRTKTLVNGITNTYTVADTYHVFNIVQCNATGGNLTAVDDLQATIPPILPTAFTQVILTASSSATNQNSESIEYASFDNRVWLKSGSGISIGGADPTSALFGNPEFPLDNVPDCVTVQGARGLPETIQVLGNYTLDTGDDLSGFLIIGQNTTRTLLTINSGANVANAEIRDSAITGTLDGPTIIRQCTLTNVSDFSGFAFECSLQPGTISLKGTGVADFLNCFSGQPGNGTPIVDANGVTNTEDVDIGFRGYNGGIEIRGLDSGAACSFDFVAGQLKVDLTTCNNGTIVARGSAKVIDAATGDYLPSGTYNTNLVITNETVNGKQMQEVWQILGLDPNAPLTINEDGSISVGNITINAVTTGVTPNRSTTQTRT
jgi:hypothetical protein